MNGESENPYTAPASDPFYPAQVMEGPVLATPGERLGGALIDGLINVPVVFAIWGVCYAMGVIGSLAEVNQIGLLGNAVVSLVAFGVFVLIQWHFLKTTGQTIGKKVMKTRIITMGGEKPSMTDLIFKRYAFMQLIALIPVVGSLLALANALAVFKKDRRCLHDMIAGTQVIKAVPAATPL